jgi:DNA helicase HerA-like ATPase
MASDFEIGRVVAVDTAQVTIELNQDLKALTRTTYEGAQEIGRINSYVVLPVGARRLVAMVTRVVLTEEAEIRADRTMVTLPAARRVMKATLIGTIDGRSFTQGVSLFPVLDNPVHLATAADLDLIFDRQPEVAGGPPDPKKPGFCIRLGDSAVFEGYPIQIDPDAFFGKHAAVLGSTGSGKSCTIASLIQSILQRQEIRRTHFVILDTNGEYRSAFQSQDGEGTRKDIGKRRFLYIPSDPSETASRLVIPYWFLNAEDFVRLFRAKEGLQAPVLLRALRLARAGAAGGAGTMTALEVLRLALGKILAHLDNQTANQQYYIPKNIRECCEDGLRYRSEFPEHVDELRARYGAEVFDTWERVVTEVKSIAQQAEGGAAALGATRIQQIRDLIDPVIRQLNEMVAERPAGVPSISADQPLFFQRGQFLEGALDTAMREEAESGNPGRVRDACGPMFLRIRRFFEDPRFGFLFDQYPDAAHVLAVFLRDALGLPSAADPRRPLSGEDELSRGLLPFYDRQRVSSPGHHVVILDLSLLAAEVLENVTALIGRLILEFLQRLGESGGQGARGSLPVVLVLEEAQNYIREPRHGEEESISRVVFERIAREGRKHGLGLVVSSQRPSELSKTVLSQCSSFVVHRLQNPEDLRYFKEIVPGIYGDLLNQLPALAPQTALVLGECVRAPALVRIREAQPLPRSRDPRFYEHWVAETPAAVPVEEICARWEGKDTGTGQGTGTPPGTDGRTAPAPTPGGVGGAGQEGSSG